MKDRHLSHVPFKPVTRDSSGWIQWLERVRDFCCPVSRAVLRSRNGDPRPYLSVSVFGVKINGLLDSGSSSTIISKKLLSKLQANRILEVCPSLNRQISTAGGHSCEIAGMVKLPFEVENRVRIINTLVVPSLAYDLIVGVDLIKACGLRMDISTMTFDFPAEVPSPTVCSIVDKTELNDEEGEALNKLTRDYFEKLDGHIGLTHLVEHVIDVGDAPPVKQRYYPVSPVIQKFINDELDSMLNQGIVEPSSSAWSSPIVVVRKSNGGYRFCIDFRRLNQVTKKDAYPLPYMSAILDRLRGARYLSSLDLQSAYWQVPLSPSSKEYTAFTVPGRGLFHFKRLPFGLHNSPATFQRLIDRVLGADLEPYVFVYLDDIIVATPDFETHLRILRTIFERLTAAGLTLHPDKCCFARSELRYLGYIVDKLGLRVDPEKVDAVLSFPTPTCPKDVRRFVGLTSWYRRFIKNFSGKIAPLTQLTRKNIKWVWNSEADSAFRELKECLVSAPVLSCPDFNRPFILQTDASNLALGAVLSQEFPEGEKAIAYASRTLSASERNYSVTEKECAAVLWAVEKFRCYLEGSHFIIITDHHSLLWLNNLKNPVGRLARWALRLQQYDYDLVHRKGKAHVVPDALSRAVGAINVAPQDHDRWYRRMTRRVRRLPLDYPQWKITGSELFKLCQPTEADGDAEPWRLVVPRRLRQIVLQENHDAPEAGHLGIFKTKKRIGALYYWPGMMSDVARYVRNCEVCLANKVEQRRPAGLLGRRVVSRPWQYVCTDIMGPFPPSTKQNRYLLVVADMFSKFALLFPLRVATSKTILRHLVNDVFLIYGVPDFLVCDNGKQFVSASFQAKISSFSCKILLNPNYHPQANPAERVNRVIKTMLASYVKEDQRTWDEQIPQIGFAIRSAVHEVTGYTPAFLNFGREVRASGGTNDDDGRGELQFGERTTRAHQLTELQTSTEKVRQRLAQAYERNARYYNQHRRQVVFNEGDEVWKRHFPMSQASKHFSAKLAPHYVKCRIYRKLSDTRYELVDSKGKNLGVWHVSMLKMHPQDAAQEEEVSANEETEESSEAEDSDRSEGVNANNGHRNSEVETSSEDEGPQLISTRASVHSQLDSLGVVRNS